jgi:hypothetical protein
MAENTRITLNLEPPLTNALLVMSRLECRSPSLQVLWIIKSEAQRRGLLPTDAPAAQPQAAEGVAHD